MEEGVLSKRNIAEHWLLHEVTQMDSIRENENTTLQKQFLEKNQSRNCRFVDLRHVKEPRS